jgi:uncharacterized protein (DUF302 family)
MLTERSAGDFAQTKTKLLEVIKAKGFTIFAEVDHAAGAAAVDQKLRPTHLIIFGNPRGGTPIMTCAQTVGIDLPLKALVWQTAEGQVNVTVNTPQFIADRHKLADCAREPLAAAGRALSAIVAEATR